MTDDERLIAALGWEPCEPNANGEAYCELHGGWITGGVCVNRADDLTLVRQGIDLACTDLVKRIRDYSDNMRDRWWPDSAPRAGLAGFDVAIGAVLSLVREWQP